jgi:hypothetical protein
MDNNTLVVVVVALLVAAAVAAWVYLRRRRSAALRERFGPEYERAVNATGQPAKAEALLEDRAKRVERFEIRPLGTADRERFVNTWRRVQAMFVDDPRGAVIEGDRLIADAMRARGYPVESFEQRADDLSVHHAGVVQHYRAGRDIAVRHERGQASTEDLRQAMVHFRALFTELVEDRPETTRRAS